MKEIDELYVFVLPHIPVNTEAVMVVMTNDGPLPMIAGDWERVEQLMPTVKNLVNDTGQEIQLVKFTSRELVNLIKPEGLEH